ncbi:hypothetical protein C0Q70_04770 [Pomacea canaliculata]|uniref:GLTSCR protein conserved domain-containing protein n=1 Tax=Pomacea canaliculata TaxID=400727 RepID=A0A2T7PJB9_POMCA|nr:hypothetical protein C0Q70_04770 [Pomacea canaliculata]
MKKKRAKLKSLSVCNVDPNIFNFIDVGNSAVSPNLEDAVGFTWADDLISSAELDPSNNSDNSGQSISQAAAAQQHVATAVQQHVLQNAVLQQQQNMGGLQLLAMGQQQPTQQIVSASDAVGISAHQVLQNQTILQGLGQQQIGSQFILKTTPGTATSIHLTQGQGHLTQTSAGSTTINGAPSQFMSSSSPVVSGPCTPSQSPGPHLSRTLTPNQALSAASGQPQITTISHPSSQQHITGATVTAAAPSSINFLQLPQSQISQQMPLQGFVTNQTAQQNNLLQGHAVLASHGSNIVHTQNALIQNPNVVNVNVAHVLPNQLNLQGALIQTAQGKFLIQAPAGGQQLPGQLNLSSLSSLGLGQSLGQASGNVALGSGSVSGQQPNFSLVNLGGPQGQQILIQRAAVSGTNIQAGPGQTNLILRTVTPSPLLQQSAQHLQTTASTAQTVNMTSAQVPQQLVAQTSAAQNLQLQQLIAGGGTQSLRLVSQPTTGAPQQGQMQTPVSSGVLLGQVMSGNQSVQQVRLIGQQAAQASSKPNTVTLNLPSQNLNLQQLQSLQRFQLSQAFTSPQQQFVIQQQQQQQLQPQSQMMSSSPVVTGSTVASSLPTSVQAANAISSNQSKKSKKLNSSVTSSNSQPGVFDNILSQALITSGIEPDDSYMDMFGGVTLDHSATPQLQSTPSPPPQLPPPPQQPTKKKKKKKKEASRDQEPALPVVLSSTKDLSKLGMTTASSTPVTVTISQSGISLQGTALQAGLLNSTYLASSQTNTATVGLPAVATTTTIGFVQKGAITSNAGVGTGTTTSVHSRGGKQGPPNVSVKPLVPNPQLSLEEKRTLLNIQTEITRLQKKPPSSLTEAERIQLQQLDMQRRKLVCQAQNQLRNAINSQKQQQQSVAVGQQTPFRISPNMVGQPLVAPAQLTSFQSVQQQDLHGADVKPLSTSTLQIQPKGSSGVSGKLRLLPAKTEPGLKMIQGGMTSETKPVLVAGSVQTSVSGPLGAAGCQMGGQTSTAGLVMTVSGQQPSVEASGSMVAGQPGVVHVHFGQSSSGMTGPAGATPQQVLLQSPHKVTVVSKGTATAVMTTAKVGAIAPQSSPSVQHVMAVTSLPPSEPRPVQIKIANQVMMLQLTPSQQEKLELHLSRMSLEQQQAFLQSQQHILAKLQRGTENALQTQTQAAAVHSASGTSISAAAVAAPTVVAAVSSDAGKKLQVVTASSAAAVMPKQLENLPLTVQQALENSHIKAEPCQSTQNSSPCKRVEIPKVSLIHQQLSRDQANALAPDTKSGFHTSREACRRLLRYHVFQFSGPSPEEFEQADDDFESISEELIEKKDTMLAKYRLLLLQESTRGFPSSEMVFIQRMMNQDMHNVLKDEKRIIEKDPDVFVPMPTKYLLKKDPQEEEEEEEVEEEEVEEEYDQDEEIDDESDAGEEEEEEEHGNKSGNTGDDVDSDHRHHDDDDDDDDGADDENCATYDSFEMEDRDDAGAPSEQSDEQVSSANTSHDDSFEAPSSGGKSGLPSPVAPSPSPSAPSRGLVKLVIRNDGKGFTSRLALERQKSSESDHRKLRTRSREGSKESSKDTKITSPALDLKISEIKREIKKEGIDDSMYGSVVNKEFKVEEKDKFSRTSLSVKLERLSEKTSQEYGIGVVNRASAGGSSRKRKHGNLHESADTSRHKYHQHASCDSGDSGARDHSAAKRELIDCSGDNNGDVSGCGASSSDIGIVPDRVRDMASESRHDGTVVECKDVQKCNQQEGNEGLLNQKHYKSIGSNSQRQAFISHSEDASRLHRRSNSSSSGSSSVSRAHVSVSSASEMESAIDSIIDMELDHQQLQQQAGHHHSDSVDLSDFGVHSPLPVDINSMQPPAFPGHIPSNLIETERMFNIGSDNEMEGSFESDGTDPQGSMMNAQMRHAINSILNSSGGSGENGEGYGHCQAEPFGSLEGITGEYEGTVTNSDIPDSQEECDDSDDAGEGCSAEEERVRNLASGTEGMDDDLDAAVQSILM